MNVLSLYLLLITLPVFISGHSWIEKLDGPYGEGMSRIGMTGSDTVLIRYFCPYDDLELCRPDPKHNVDLWNQPAENGDPRRPCRPNMISKPKTPTMPGANITIHWAGNGHVNNGQSYGTCVKVMIGPFKPDPSIDEFSQIADAECLDYWIFDEKGTEDTQGVITIPDTLAPGSYTLFWVWNFTEFWYSSCADIDVLSDEGTRVPTRAPVFEGPDEEVIQDYLDNGCADLQDPDNFCMKYAGFGTGSYCNNDYKDECGRSSCNGLDTGLLHRCPDCPPLYTCPTPKAFYDDFSNGFNSNKWLKAHKTWDINGGGVVSENFAFDDTSKKVILKAHGSLYNGDTMGVIKEGGKYLPASNGKLTGAAIVSRDYFGAGSYEVRMKIVEELGACSAMWTFFYKENEDNSIVNHEIDIELPGRPGAAHNGIGFDKALMNTFVSESLYATNYTQLDAPMNDGQFHTWRFDWHTDPSNRKVEFYLDGKHFSTNREHVPFYASRLWIGVWFPTGWAGEANFDVSQMEIDYVKFTPYEDESYECPPESYPKDGFAPGTYFKDDNMNDNAPTPIRCTPSTAPNVPIQPTPVPSPVMHQGPVASPTLSPAPAPVGNTPESYLAYLENGCKDLHFNFCGGELSGSYCKDWSADSCGRSICHGHDFSLLYPCNPPPPPPSDDENVYKATGCSNIAEYDSFCIMKIGEGSYCKFWNSDHCGRSICQGDDYSSLNPC